MTLKTVKVPAPFEAIFKDAETYVEKYFQNFKQDIHQGTIEIAGERYILVRADSMSVHFLEFIKNMYPSLNEEEALEASAQVLFDMSHVIGKSDARAFHEKLDVKDPIQKLSTGPIHFAYSGWAHVEINPDSNPSPDENFCLVYNHRQSFEADSWLRKTEKTKFCTCFMNAGYSSGWCEASFGVPLVAREIMCRARGDESCLFIMAQPHRLEEFIHAYRKNNFNE